MNTVTSQSVFEHNDLGRATRHDCGVAGIPVLTGWVSSLSNSPVARAFRRTIVTSIGGMIALIVLSSGMINLLLQLR